jgi:hypothetical protein
VPPGSCTADDDADVNHMDSYLSRLAGTWHTPKTENGCNNRITSGCVLAAKSGDARYAEKT